MKLYLENNQEIPAVKILKDSDAAPSGYTDSSNDLILWKNFGIYDSTDYLQLRMYVQEALNSKGWGNLSNEEKDFVISFHLSDSNIDGQQNAINKITHLITTGQASSQGSARSILVKAWSVHHVKEKKASRLRLDSERVYEVIGNYLSTDDGADFFQSISSLFSGFAEQGIKGTNDGLSVEGLFDYIESTAGTVYESSGLSSKNYTMQNGDSDSLNFISDLMDVLRNGNY